MHWGMAGLYRVRGHSDIINMRDSSTACVLKGFHVAALGCVAISSTALDVGSAGEGACILWVRTQGARVRTQRTGENCCDVGEDLQKG